MTDNLMAGVALGLTDSKVQSTLRTHGPYTPKFTSNLYLQYDHELDNTISLGGRIDYRHQSSQYLGRNDMFHMDAKDYVDLRIHVGYERYKLSGYVKNLTNERQAFGFEDIGFGYLRYNNNPRSYGAELSFKF